MVVCIWIIAAMRAMAMRGMMEQMPACSRRLEGGVGVIARQFMSSLAHWPTGFIHPETGDFAMDAKKIHTIETRTISAVRYCCPCAWWREVHLSLDVQSLDG